MHCGLVDLVTDVAPNVFVFYRRSSASFLRYSC
jgi:hypothetical protein